MSNRYFTASSFVDVADETNAGPAKGHLSLEGHPVRPRGVESKRKEQDMEARSRIAVTGATGRVGRPLVEVLESRGHEVVPISRSHGVDIVTGEGLDSALAGVEYVVDAATGASPEQQAATEFFTASARNLQAAGAGAGVRRIVVVSIIGTDRFTAGYGVAKLVHEQAMLAGPVPARIVRAAQFHEFVAQMVEWGTQGDVSYVPDMRTQLVAAQTVAEALADVAVNGSEIREVAGPREESLVDAARLLVGHSLRIEGVTDPNDPDHDLYTSGGMLPGPDALLAGPTFAEWLAGAGSQAA